MDSGKLADKIISLSNNPNQLSLYAIELNKKVLYNQYMELEDEHKREPSEGWFNFYILTHFLKAPFLCPMILLLAFSSMFLIMYGVVRKIKDEYVRLLDE